MFALHLSTVAAFIVALGILIFIHELGHFAVAKAVGVRVEKFSLGFGPKLVSIVRGDTEYRIGALPLGGYVKMSGDEPGEDAADPAAFNSKSVAARFGIIFAGPLMNFILPFFIMPIVFLVGIEVPAYLSREPVVGWVVDGSPAEEADIRIGDRILRIDDLDVEDWEDALNYLNASPNSDLTITMEREGEEIRKALTPRPSKDFGVGVTGIVNRIPAHVDAVEPGSRADEAGIEPGDRIVRVNGEEIVHFFPLVMVIREAAETPVDITVERDSELVDLRVTPARDEETGWGVLGIREIEDKEYRQYGLGESLIKGWESVIETTALVGMVLGKLCMLEMPLKALGGPIMVAHAAGQAARAGVSYYLHLIALLSISLAILNLLPIPVLDGGHIFFLVLEAVIRRPINLRAREVAQHIGLMMLILLMLAVTYNDIIRILPWDLPSLFGE